MYLLGLNVEVNPCILFSVNHILLSDILNKSPTFKMQDLLSFSRSFHFKLYMSLLSLKASSSASIFYVLQVPESVLRMMIHAISQLVDKLYQYHLEMWKKIPILDFSLIQSIEFLGQRM